MPKFEAHGVEVSYDRIEHHAKAEHGPMMTVAEYRILHHQALPSDILPHQSSGQRTGVPSSTYDKYADTPDAKSQSTEGYYSGRAEKTPTTGGGLWFPISKVAMVCVALLSCICCGLVYYAREMPGLARVLFGGQP